MHKRKYKFRLTALFVFVLTLCVCAFMVVYTMYVSAQQSRVREQTLLAEASLRFDMMNTNLLTVFHTLSYISQSDSMKALARSTDESEMFFNAIAAQKEIARNTVYASHLDSYRIAVVYDSPLHSLVITESETISLNTFAHRLGTARDVLEQTLDDAAAKPYGHLLLYAGTDENHSVSYITAKEYGDARQFFVLTIDKENFENAFALTQCSDWVIVSDEDVLFSKYPETQEYILLRNAVQNELEDLSATVSVLNGTQKRQHILGAKFSEIGWTFLATYPETTFSPGQVTILFIVPLLLLLLGALLLARLLSSRLYAPIASLMSQFGEMPEESDEFDFIRTETHKITEKAQELDESLAHSRRLLDEQIYKNALLDENFSNEGLDAALRTKHFVVALAELAEEPTEDDAFAQAKLLLRKAVQTQSGVHFVGMGATAFALVLEADDEAQARTLAEQLFAQTGLSGLVQLRVALSASGVGLAELHLQMRQCNHLLEYRHNLSDQMYVTAEDAARIYYEGYYYPMQVENKLVQMTVRGTEGALALLEEVLHENLVSKLLSPENKRSFFFALISTLNRVYLELQLGETSDYPAVDALLAMDDEALAAQLRATFARIVWATSHHNEHVGENLSQQMLAYIHENYRQDISLDDIASKMNVSPKYCSALFKKQTGTTFKKALNEYRILRAKEILRKTPEIRIGDLAVEVGFISANTFIQVFKQYTGTTPLQYAKQNHAADL